MKTHNYKTPFMGFKISSLGILSLGWFGPCGMDLMMIVGSAIPAAAKAHINMPVLLSPGR